MASSAGGQVLFSGVRYHRVLRYRGFVSFVLSTHTPAGLFKTPKHTLKVICILGPDATNQTWTGFVHCSQQTENICLLRCIWSRTKLLHDASIQTKSAYLHLQ